MWKAVGVPSKNKISYDARVHYRYTCAASTMAGSCITVSSLNPNMRRHFPEMVQRTLHRLES